MKIKKDQLKEIQEQQNVISNILNKIGYIESQKHGLLHELAGVNQEVADSKLKLEKEYGQVNIDLQTGEYTPIKEEVVEEVENI